MKRHLVLAIAACMLALAPSSALAAVGSNVEIVYANTGQSVHRAALMNGEYAPDGGEGMMPYYHVASGFRTLGMKAGAGSFVWEQDAGNTTGPLVVKVDRRINACHDSYTDSEPFQDPEDSYGFQMWHVTGVALAAAPYATATITLPSVTVPVAPGISAAELDFLARVNAERARLGRAPLRLDMRLSMSADSHSHWQDRLGQASTHCGRGQSDIMRRMQESGHFEIPGTGVKFSEVVSWQTKMTGEFTWATYSKSSAHYNILTSASYSCIGIGFSASHTTGDLASGECDTDNTGTKLPDESVEEETSDETLVRGRMMIGSRLSCASGPLFDEQGNEMAAPVRSYRWERATSADEYSGQAVGHSASYTVRGADQGRYLRCVVFAASAIAPSESTWRRVAVVKLALKTRPKMGGKARVGQVVRCSAGRWAGASRVTRTFQVLGKVRVNGKLRSRWVRAGGARVKLRASLKGRKARCLAAATNGRSTLRAASNTVTIR
jgi:uncharacterized protein YkwD